jgi:hypothetical protein
VGAGAALLRISSGGAPQRHAHLVDFGEVCSVELLDPALLLRLLLEGVEVLHEEVSYVVRQLMR